MRRADLNLRCLGGLADPVNGLSSFHQVKENTQEYVGRT